MSSFLVRDRSVFYNGSMKDGVVELQELAWVGDAVLSLWAREWLLKRDGKIMRDRFSRLTSNQFLTCFGTPTKVEARFGQIYRTEGLASAFETMERELVPVFEKQERNRAKGRG